MTDSEKESSLLVIPSLVRIWKVFIRFYCILICLDFFGTKYLVNLIWWVHYLTFVWTAGRPYLFLNGIFSINPVMFFNQFFSHSFVLHIFNVSVACWFSLICTESIDIDFYNLLIDRLQWVMYFGQVEAAYLNFLPNTPSVPNW